MKRIAMIAVMVLMTLAATAQSAHYFTYGQALRTVAHLNAQQEMMIYCGYDYEVETYVLINEVWMEPVNSAYYEIWVYGYDAYTGDEVYMPLDLKCVWLVRGSKIYNAAQYLRFQVSVQRPGFAWYIPPYNPFVRARHATGYARSYHYNVHCHGWMPPHPRHNQRRLPPYYMRPRTAPAPAPTAAWTPGTDRPNVVEHTRSTDPTTGTPTNSSYNTRGTVNRGNNARTATTRRSEGSNNNTSTNTRRSEGNNVNTPTNTRRSEGKNSNTSTNTRRSEGNNSNTSTNTRRSEANNSNATTPTRSNTSTRNSSGTDKPKSESNVRGSRSTGSAAATTSRRSDNSATSEKRNTQSNTSERTARRSIK